MLTTVKKNICNILEHQKKSHSKPVKKNRIVSKDFSEDIHLSVNNNVSPLFDKEHEAYLITQM